MIFIIHTYSIRSTKLNFLSKISKTIHFITQKKRKREKECEWIKFDYHNNHCYHHENNIIGK